MKVLMIAGLCAALGAIPAMAQERFGPSRLTVTATGGGFAVENDIDHGARGMWCAAGEYIRATGRDAPKQRIYVAEPRPMTLGARGPVVFTLDPAGRASRGALISGLSLARAGSSMSVAHARTLCNALQSAGR